MSKKKEFRIVNILGITTLGIMTVLFVLGILSNPNINVLPFESQTSTLLLYAAFGIPLMFFIGLFIHSISLNGKSEALKQIAAFGGALLLYYLIFQLVENQYIELTFMAITCLLLLYFTVKKKLTFNVCIGLASGFGIGGIYWLYTLI
ncbi:putative membrane protein [Dysgonomonas sp. PFB1-18]|uniref:hypothetical protein n=1 Tax=unclassified Dysgonomonas TaxID=2630389 RepID=UPI002473FB77|nr:MULTISPECIES: hypothetical protein [unclassified Dysgonomonas]MDH6311211.1 putative membrane protein [Dysgonomonas sp. PF1-14]MDH6341097.1 putative membrane protein [Dysgonomonas sp. PF1-16]MDH6382533.1 putative membrane protein [Dysgonomonas sp. PFB1-18]MDH6399933.1 putative membrane protein [Dysgonomonas sp. PF1-23]